MTPTRPSPSGALALAAQLWQRLLLPAGAAPMPQLLAIAVRRETGRKASRALPSPFRPHGA